VPDTMKRSASAPADAPSHVADGTPAHNIARALLTFAWVVYSVVVLASGVGLAPLASRVTAWALLGLGVVAALLSFARRTVDVGAPCTASPALRVMAGALFAFGLAATVLATLLATLLPVGAYDALGYRLPAIAQWLDAGAVVWVGGDDQLRNGYPLGLEVIGSVLFRALDSAAAVDAVASLFLFAAAAALFGFVRSLRGAAAGLLAAGLFLLAPMHLLNAPSGYADAAFAGALVVMLIACVRLARGDAGATYDLGITLALVIALKPHGFAFAAVALIGLLVAHARTLRSLARALPRIAVLLAPGLFFALRNVVHTGNPLYPVEVKAFGRVWLRGESSLDGILTPDFNVPRELAALPALLRPLWVWLQPHGPARSYDDRLAGLGYAFVLVALPALVWLVARCLRGTLADAERRSLLLLLACTLVCFALQPLSFWPRFSSWMWGAGAVASALLVAELAARRPPAALAISALLLLLTVPEGAYALAHVKSVKGQNLASLFEGDHLTVLSRVAGVKRAFVERALVGRSDVCRTPWILGTDDANLDGVVAQLSPRPRMHVVDVPDPAQLSSLLRVHGCSELIAIGDSPLVARVSSQLAVHVEKATAFGRCHLLSLPPAIGVTP
jgi:hypothetical protein